jgi:YD repeat-containing protein
VFERVIGMWLWHLAARAREETLVAIVVGNSLGLNLSSLGTLGQRGTYGSALTGRNGELAYVNSATGNLVLQDRDDALMGRGLSVPSVRTYNSLGQLNDDNGDTWSLGAYNQQLKLVGAVNTAGSSFVRTDRDGSQATYTYDSASSQYVSTDGGGAHDRIRAEGSTWTWTDGDTGVQERYSASNGTLASVTDLSGNTLTYAYNSAGLLTSISKSNGEQTFYDYTGNQLTQIRTVVVNGTTSQTLTRVRYGYDTSNRLSSVTVDLSPEDGSVDDGKTYVTTYTYDGTSRRVASVSQQDGTRLSFTYDTAGRVITATDALGNQSRYTYDTAARQTTLTDPLGRKTVVEYDEAGRLVRMSALSGTATLQTVSYAYNAAGDVVRITDGDGNAVAYDYDSNGNRTYQRDAVGNTVTRTYNAQNRVLTESVYATPDPDGAGAAQPGAPLTTRYVYDAAGKGLLRYVISREGRVTEHLYDPYGQRTSTLDYAGGSYPVGGLALNAAPSLDQMAAWTAAQDRTQMQRVDMVYDVRGLLQKTTTYAATTAAGAGVADSGRSVTQYVCDSFGQLLQTIAPLQGATTYTYDGLGRVLSSTDAQSVVTLTSYDDASNTLRQSFANGLVTTSTYDKAGRKVSVLQSSAGQALGETRYFYDAANQLRMTQDPTGVRQWMLYDDAGRKVADVDANGSLIEYLYNRNGQVTKSIAYATAVNTAALVDATGQPANVALSAIRPPASTADRAQWVAYDAAGRPVKTVSASGAVVETFYDGVSRVVKTTRYNATIVTTRLGDAPKPADIVLPPLPPGGASADRSTRSFYDKDGRLAGQLDAEGYLTEYQYDGAGRRTVTLRYATQSPSALWAAGTLDQLRPAANAASDIRTVTLYDGKGQAVGVIDAENYLTERVYDNNGNLTRQVRYATVLSSTVAPTALLASIRPAANALDQSMTWVYDKLNRVTQQTNAEGTVTKLVYDSVGNLTSTTAAAGAAEARVSLSRFDLQGRLIAELSGEGAALLTTGQTQDQIDAIWNQYGTFHTYDSAGRRTSTTQPSTGAAGAAGSSGAKTLFFYDVDGRLTHTVNALGEVEERQYNALGDLVATVRYGGRVSTAGLGGGLVNTAITQAIQAVANAARDRRTTYAYNSVGLLASTSDALNHVVTFGYDAFGAETTRTTTLDGGLTRIDLTSYDRRGLKTSSTRDSGGLAVLTRWGYDAFGRRLTETDGNGKLRSQSFDRLGRTVQTTDGNGNSRRTTYDAFDRVLTQTDALGQTTTYAYSNTERSVTVTTPEGVSVKTLRNRHGETLSITDGKQQVTRYTYDRDGNLTSTATPLTKTTQVFDRAGRLIETTDARGVKVSYAYDAANRVLERRVDPTGLNLVTTYAYDALGQQVSVTDPKGIVTTTSYALDGQVLTQTVDPSGLNLVTRYTRDAEGRVLTVTSPRGVVTRYVYDKLGRRIEETIDPKDLNPKGLGLKTTYAYDNNGNVVSRTDANGATTRYAYDGENRLLFSMDALGGTVRNEYDREGRISRSTRYAAPISTANLAIPATAETILARVVATPGKDAVQANRYDRDGRLTYTVDGVGAVIKFAYDQNGNVIERVAYANAIDLSTWTGLADPVVAEDAARDQRVRMVYDALDRLTFQADALGAVTERKYDANGNVVRLVEHAVPVTGSTLPSAVTNDAADRISVYAYDNAKRETWRADPSGAVTRSEYDADGNVVRSTRYAKAITPGGTPSGVAQQPALDRVTRYSYDSAGRRTYAVDALNLVNRWEYDKDGNVQATTRYATPIAVDADPASVALNAALDRKDAYVYDLAGRVSAHTDAMGATESYTYDGLGHKKTYTNQKNSVWTYEYDAAGRLTREVSPQVAVTNVVGSDASALSQGDVADMAIESRYTYDALGNLLSRTEAAGRPEQRRTDYEYDARGKQIKVTYPAVGVYSESISALGTNGLSALAGRAEATRTLSTRTYYDAFGQAVANVDVAGNASFKAYDPAGKVRYEVDALGYVTSYKRNAFGDADELLRYAVPTNLAQTVPTSARQAPSVAAIAAVVDAPSVDHSADRLLATRFDALGRAIEVKEPAAYSYDSGRATLSVPGTYEAAVGKTTTNTYSVFGELALTSVGGGGIAPVKTYAYFDKLGRKTATVDALGYVTQHSYDEVGNLIATKEFATAARAGSWSLTTAAPTPATSTDDRTTTWAYDRNNRKVSETRVGVAYSTGDAATVTGNLVTTYGYDAVGNLTRTTDSQGASVYSYYDALGRMTALASPARAGAAEGSAVTPLTVFLRDAHGNVVVKLDLANGAAAAGEFTGNSQLANPGFALGAGSADDRRTVSRYDAMGHVVQSTDAQGNNHYSSYNELGLLAKSWQSVTDEGATQTLFQAFQYDKLGRVTHTLDPAPYVAQKPTGGVTDSALEYNAFGEVVARRINGTVQEYFEFDNAGRMVRTNSGDGSQKVYLYDVLGRRTAEIRSSGLDAVDLRTASIPTAASLATARRTHTVYDALGRVVNQLLPQRADEQGGVTVRRQQTVVSIASTQTIEMRTQGTGDASGDAPTWVGENRVNLSWTSLAGLGAGEVKVEFEYLTRPYMVSAGGSEEGGVVTPPVYSTPDLRKITRIYTAEEAAAGVQFVWADADGQLANVNAGISEAKHLVVSKKDINGVWQRVSDQTSFGFVGNTVEVATPLDPNTRTRVAFRPQGGAWTAPVGINFGASQWFNASTLPLGAYDYEIYTTVVGQPEQLTASGTFKLETPPLAVIGTAVSYGQPNVPQGVLAWQKPGSGTVQQLNYRRAGSFDGWQSLSVSSRTSTQDGVDTTGLPAGEYEFELLWSEPNSGIPYAHATGTFNVIAAVPPRQVPAVSAPNITGITVNATSVSWDSVLGVAPTVTGTNAAYITGLRADGGKLSWTPVTGTAAVQIRAAGASAWTDYAVETADGVQRVDIAALTTGSYEYRITYTRDGKLTAMGSGTLTVPTPPALTMGLAAITGYQATASAFSWTAKTGTVTFEARIGSNSAWQTFPVETLNGRHSVNLAGASGTYEFRISYGTDTGLTAYGMGTLAVTGGTTVPKLTLATGQVTGFSSTAQVLKWARGSGIAKLEGRAVGSTQWATIPVADYGGADGVDISGLAKGDYEFLVTYTQNDRATAFATGRLSVQGPPALSNTTASQVTGFEASGTTLRWTPLAGTVALEYFNTTTNAWVDVPVSRVNGRDMVDFGGAVGTFQFRVTYKTGDTITGLGTGTLTVQAGTSTAIAGTPKFEFRAANASTWSEVPVTAASAGRANASFAGVPPGDYEFRINYTSGTTTVATGTGTAKFYAPVPGNTPTPTLANTSVSPIAGYSVSGTTVSWTASTGTPTFEYRTANGTWSTRPVTRNGATDSINTAGLAAGAYEFRIVYDNGNVTLTLGSGNFTAYAEVAGTTPNPTLGNTAATPITGFSATSAALSWPTQSGTALFEGRAVGSSTWVPLPVIVASPNSRVDISGLGAGDYEFRVSYQAAGGLSAFGAGNLKVSEKPAPVPVTPTYTDTTAASVITAFSVSGATVSWTRPAGVTAADGVLEYRVLPDTNWRTLTISSSGATDTASFAGVTGTAEFRATYKKNGSEAALGMGTYTAAQPTVSGPTNTAQAAVTGFNISGFTFGWTPPSVSGTPKFEYSVAGTSAWSGSLQVNTGAQHSVNVAFLAPNNYEYRVTYTDANNKPVAMAMGQFRPELPSVLMSAVSNAPASTFQISRSAMSWMPANGTEKFAIRNATTGNWDELANVITIDGAGRHTINVSGTTGTVDFRLWYEEAPGIVSSVTTGRFYAPDLVTVPTLSNLSQASITGTTVSGNVLSWNRPATGGTPTLVARLAGTQTWSDALLLNIGGTTDSYNFASVVAGAPGDYEYRLTYTIPINGTPVAVAVATGVVAIRPQPKLISQAPTLVSGFAVSSDASLLSWVGRPGAGHIYYRPSGTSAWLDGGTPGVDPATQRHLVTLANLATGSYDFLISYEDSSGLTSVTTGQLTRTVPTPSASASTTTKITGIGVTPTTFYWNAGPAGGTSKLYARVGTAAWAEQGPLAVANGRVTYTLPAQPSDVTYEFLIVNSDATGRAVALGTGTLHTFPSTQPATPAPVLSNTTVPVVSGYQATPTQLRWTAVSPSTLSVVFEGRPVGGTDWAVLPVTTANGVASVNLPALTPEAVYEFRILYKSGNAIVARGAGNITPHAGTPATTPPPTLSNLTPAAITGYGTSATALSWAAQAGTVKFEGRLLNATTWDTPWDVTTSNGRSSVSLQGKAPGTYEFRVTYTNATGVTTALGYGTVTVYEPVAAYTPPPTYTITTVPYTAGYTIPGSPTQYTSATNTVTGSPALSLTGSNAAYVLTQTPAVNGKTTWLRPEIRQTVDRWGNVLKTNDPRNVAWETTYKWNAANQLVYQQRPSTTGNAADAPTTQIYYDALGRQVAVRDANGNVNKQAYDAGGNLVMETHADKGVVTHRYNAFGDKVTTVDAEGNVAAAGSADRAEHTTNYGYDKLGRLTSVTHGPMNVFSITEGMVVSASVRRNVTESYSYDGAGRKLTQTDGDGRVTHYKYDHAGRVTETRLPLGTTTRVAYDVFGNKLSETDANGRTATWATDYFGRTTQHVDIGGQTVTYAYDIAGQRVAQTSTRNGSSAVLQNLRYTYDAAGQLLEIKDLALDKTSTYRYDLAGNHVLERTVQAGKILQDNHLAYDQLGQLRDVADGRVRVSFNYDKNGNRTYVGTHINVLKTPGDTSADEAHDSPRYFLYDSMNRQVVVDAVDAQGNIGRQGHVITYDKNGNRLTDTFWGNRVITNGGQTVLTFVGDSDEAVYSQVPYTYTSEQGNVREEYRYNATGQLTSVVRDGVQVDYRKYDASGHVLETGPGNLPQGYASALNHGVPQAEAIGLENRRNRYDANGRLLQQKVLKSDGAAKYDLDYRNGYDPAGNVTSYKFTESGKTTTYSNVLGQYEGYVQKSTTGTRDGKSGTTESVYDVNGQLMRIDDQRDDANDRTFINDASGRALLVDQGGNLQRQLIVNGEVLGRFGVGLDELEPRGSDGAPHFAPLAEFSFGYQPINGNYPGASPGVYAVQQGDTLQSIARGAYGDAKLWFRIAEANGLSSDADLRVGQSLTVPNIAASIHNDGSTFKPYDPSKITGDTTPTIPPPSAGGCGAIGQIIMVVVAIVVTIYTAGAAAGAMSASVTTAAGTTVSAASMGSAWAAGTAIMSGAGVGAAAVGAAAIGAAVGSIASQAIGMATGMQEEFSWKGVALAALGGGVSAGLPTGLGSNLGATGQVMARAAMSNAMTQGVAVVTGLQEKFQWKSVAASAVGAGVGNSVGATLNDAWGGSTLGDFAVRSVSSMAAGVTASVVRGGRVNVQQVAADAFGNALGDSIVGAAISDLNLSNGSYRNEMDRESDRYDRAFNYSYRNGSDIDSDRAYQARRDQEWVIQSDAIQSRRLNEEWTARREQQWIDQSDAILAGRAAEALDGRNGMDVQSDAWVAVHGQGKVGHRTLTLPVRPDSAATARQRELNRFAEMGVASGASPVWNMRDASAAQREQFKRDYEDRLARSSGQSLSAVDQRAEQARQAALAQTRTQLGLAVGGPVFVGYAAGAKLAGAPDDVVNNIGVAQAGIVMSLAAPLVSPGAVSGSPVDLRFDPSIEPFINVGKQSRHVLGTKEYDGPSGGKSYFRQVSDAQDVLSAYQGGQTVVVGRGSDGGPIVRFDAGVGFNHNPGAGFPNQPTNIFWIKGSSSVSVVPMSPTKGQ